MNIFRFHLKLTNKNSETEIPVLIQNLYKDKFRGNGSYDDHVIKQWEGIPGEQIKALYATSAILASGRISQTLYFIINSEPSNDITHSSIEVIVRSQQTITKAYKTVSKDIKKKLKAKFSITLDDRSIWVFIYNQNEKDVIRTDLTLKAEINENKVLSKSEIIRDIIIGGISFVLLIVVLCLKQENDGKAILGSIIASGVFFLISDFVCKLVNGVSIEIRDFSAGWVDIQDELVTAPIKLEAPDTEE